jgi:hypothetical protein
MGKGGAFGRWKQRKELKAESSRLKVEGKRENSCLVKVRTVADS